MADIDKTESDKPLDQLAQRALTQLYTNVRRIVGEGKLVYTDPRTRITSSLLGEGLDREGASMEANLVWLPAHFGDDNKPPHPNGVVVQPQLRVGRDKHISIALEVVQYARDDETLRTLFADVDIERMARPAIVAAAKTYREEADTYRTWLKQPEEESDVEKRQQLVDILVQAGLNHATRKVDFFNRIRMVEPGMTKGDIDTLMDRMLTEEEMQLIRSDPTSAAEAITVRAIKEERAAVQVEVEEKLAVLSQLNGVLRSIEAGSCSAIPYYSRRSGDVMVQYVPPTLH